MKKYFIIERSDGKKFNVRNKTEWLIENKLFHLDRSLRDKGWVKNKQDGLKYKCEKDYVESLDEIEFGDVKCEILTNDEIDDLLGGLDISEDEDDLLEGLDLNPQKAKEICEEEESFPFGDNLDKDYEQLKKEYDKKSKQVQHYQDLIRITRRENRFDDRIGNIIENMHNELRESIPKFIPDKITPTFVKRNDIKQGVIQLSDIHATEVVEGGYNLDIMDKRLKCLFEEALVEFNYRDISIINILMTGDLINAEHHLDKMLTNQKTRVEGLKILFQSLSSNIDYLLNAGFEIRIAGILGNESRLNGYEKMSAVNEIAMNNLDYLLMVLLQARYGNNVEFLNNGDVLEEMIHSNGKNIILCHGHSLKQTNEKVLTDEVIKLKHKWFLKTGIMADLVILGHIHSTWLNHIFCRSASLVGGNGYSENTLNIPQSHASQNIYIVGDTIKPIPILLD